MNESRSATYSLAMGMAGGLLAWAGVEVLLSSASSLPDLRTVSLALGGVSGFLLGAVAPAAEGLRQAQPRKVAQSVVFGALLGCVGGALGMVGGQFLLSLIADRTYFGTGMGRFTASLARLPGWAITGAVVGSVSGLRAKSPGRAASGALGGFLGGLLGGVAAEILAEYAGRFIGRGVGLLCWGTAVALIGDRMDARRARGRLTVLAGPLKGRSFPVNQRRFRVGTSPVSDLTIPGEAAAAKDDASGAVLSLKKGTVVLEASEKTEIRLNGESRPLAEATELKYDDVIKVGDVTMIYEARR